MAKDLYKDKKGLSKSSWAIIILSVVVLVFLVYFITGLYNSAQTKKLNNAAMYGAGVRDVQLFADSANCNPVFVTAFDADGNQLQKVLMELNTDCAQVYQQAAAQLTAAIQQQAEMANAGG